MLRIGGNIKTTRHVSTADMTKESQGNRRGATLADRKRGAAFPSLEIKSMVLETVVARERAWGAG